MAIRDPASAAPQTRVKSCLQFFCIAMVRKRLGGTMRSMVSVPLRLLLYAVLMMNVSNGGSASDESDEDDEPIDYDLLGYATLQRNKQPFLPASCRNAFESFLFFARIGGASLEDIIRSRLGLHNSGKQLRFMVTRCTGGNIHNFKTALKVLLVGILLGTAAAAPTPFANQEGVVRRLNEKQEYVSILLPDHTYGIVQKPAHSAPAAEFGKTQGVPLSEQVFGAMEGTSLLLSEAKHLASELLVEGRRDEFSIGGHLLDKVVARGVDKSIPIKDSVHFLLHTWDKVMRDAGNYTYWLFAGTLLGQWCNEGTLPKDDDADISMEANEFLHFSLRIAGEPKLLPENIQLIIRHGKHADIIAAKWGDLRTGRFIDISLFHNMRPMEGNQGGLFHSWSTGSRCPGCVEDKLGVRLEAAKSMLLPTKRCNFEGLQLQCPAQVLELCRKMYGQRFFNCAKETKTK